MPITKAQLKAQIKAAYDFESEKELTEVGDLAAARDRVADKIANSVEAYVIGRTVAVTGVQPGSGAAQGTIQ